MSDWYGVMGNPVSHSKSPLIHAEFAAQTGQAMRYDAFDVPIDGFADALATFWSDGGKGVNVTVPFKEEGFRLMDVTTPAARRAGAVNPIWFGEQGKRHGDNTDGAGLIADLVINHRVAIRARRILLVGAGGAARGAIGPLLDEGPELLLIANRTRHRAEALAREFVQAGPAIASGLDEVGTRQFDVVINATSAGLSGDVPRMSSAIFGPATVGYDMVYGVSPTAFVAWSLGAGAARAIDGLGMLVEQAAASFERWRGVRPATAPVISLLREQIGTRREP